MLNLGMVLSGGANDVVQEALTTNFTQIQSDILGYLVIGMTAGVVVMGVKIAVKVGLSFFSTIVKKG